MYRYQTKRSQNDKDFLRKVFACIIGIIILLFIAGTYRNYIIREGKAPYLTVKELLPQLKVFVEITGNGSYEEIIIEQEKRDQEYVTVGTIREILGVFPEADVSVLEAYKKDSWYIGVSDWNVILLDIVKKYGTDMFFATEQTILGDENTITDAEGNPLGSNQVLTDRGVMDAVYWNMDTYLYSRVLTVCYENRILSVVRYSDEQGNLENVYLADTSEGNVHLFTDNYHMRYPLAENNSEAEDGKAVTKNGKELTPGSIVDVEFDQGSIVVITEETEFIHGKLLQVSDRGIEVEGYGIFEPSEDMKVYRLYSELVSLDKKDLRIGYSFTDFVLENGKVAACLMIKEEDMESIRVLLKNTGYEGRYHESFEAVCDQDCELIYYENGIESRREVKTAGDPICIQAEDLERGTGRIKLLPKVLSAKTIVESIGRSQGIPVYKGSFEITGTEDGLLVVNEVLLEDYLCKVVPSEMPSSYPKEALMAQAVCARTYAYGKMIKTGLPDLGAHVDDSAGFQVYNNIMEQASTTEAVKATHNMVAVYEGDPIGTYYYSTSSGAGTDTSIWHGGGEIPPYLQALMIEKNVEDGQGDEGAEALDTKITPDELMQEEVFREWIQKSDPAAFEAEEGWYRWTYTVEELDSEYMCSVLQKRYESNPNLILTETEDGEFVSQPVTKLGRIENIEVVKRLSGGVADELLITGSKAVVKVISELNIRYVLADGTTKVVRQSGDEADASSSIPSAYMVLNLEKEDDVVTGYQIIGGGFGHGVGMSQNGAKNMALNGMSCEEILTFFYPGTELKTLQFGE